MDLSFAGKLDTNELKHLKIFIPYPPEQRKIIEFLGVVDEKINLLRKKRELFERYKRGLMQKLFSQDRRFRQDDGSAFPDWKRMCLDDLCTVNPKEETPPTFRYIDLASVTNGALADTKTFDKDTAPSRAQRVLERRDIIFQTVRPYQMNNLFFDLPGDYVVSTGYAVLRSESSDFVFQSFSSILSI